MLLTYQCKRDLYRLSKDAPLMVAATPTSAELGG